MDEKYSVYLHENPPKNIKGDISLLKFVSVELIFKLITRYMFCSLFG